MAGFQKVRLAHFIFAFCIANIFGAVQADEKSMNFRIVETPEQNFTRLAINGGRYDIYASGVITADSVEIFNAFVKLHKIDHARVNFDSAGGSLIGGIELGKAIRKLGFETDVESEKYEYGKGPVAICASACSYAYVGGTARFYDDQVGKIGLHQFYGPDDNYIGVSGTQSVSGLIVAYLDKMGVDGRMFALSTTSDKDSMAWLSTEDAERFGIANNGIEPTSAEIKLVDGRPYLRLEQNYNNVTSRVLVFCEGQEYHLFGGIVTTPENSLEQFSYYPISLLEFDQTPYQPMPNRTGSKVDGSVVWIERKLGRSGLDLFLKSNTLGMWIHNNGAMRWGSYINISQVRPQLKNFIDNCRVK